MPNHWTPTQQKIINVLSDGQPHQKRELQDCLDELAEPNAIHVHVTLIRRKLRPVGEEILCVNRDGKSYFRHVRVVSIGD
jgi:hypothetical protein